MQTWLQAIKRHRCRTVASEISREQIRLKTSSRDSKKGLVHHSQNKASYAVNVPFIGLLPLRLGLKDILSIRKGCLLPTDVFGKVPPVTHSYAGKRSAGEGGHETW